MITAPTQSVRRSPRRSRAFATALAAFVVLGAGAGGAAVGAEPKDAPDVAAARREVFRSRVIERLDRLQNVTVRFRSTTTPLLPTAPTSTRPTRSPNGVILGAAEAHPRTLDCTFRYLDGRAWFETRPDADTSRLRRERGEFELPHNLVVTSHERSEGLTVRNESRWRQVGAIRDRQPLPVWSTIDVALGLRCMEEPDWIDREAFRTADVEGDPADRLMAISIDAVRKGRKVRHTWTFDQSGGPLALASYAVRIAGDELAFYEIRCSNFRTVGAALSLPLTVLKQRVGRVAPGSTETKVWEREELHVDEYVSDDPGNTPETFTISFPGGTYLRDHRVGLQMKAPTTGPVSDAYMIRRVDEKFAQYPRAARLEEPRSFAWVWPTIVPLAAVAGIAIVLRSRARPGRTGSAAAAAAESGHA